METLLKYEFTILDFIQSDMTSPVMDKIMTVFTYLGSYGLIWILLAVLLLSSARTRKNGVIMAVSLIGCLLIGNIILKPLIGRIRPSDVNAAVDLLIKKPLDASFPSGHTMSSFAGAMCMMFYSIKYGIPAMILALIISFSRLYLYVHYPTDILAGAILGILIALLSKKIVETYLSRKNAMVIDRFARKKYK
ncbi:phosphatase PAP2 family protein [Proteocatella sphenisci]|uniref:phosphatase PAP2 family protein n=1 Tax=Proteocatella sphenisci TaxID=181070 RepID=UPI0004B10D82|nr:phosphatase PAP2 family protein [Proteocatella sphenisci]